MDIKEIGILSSEIDQHWYYKAKFKALKRVLTGISPTKILDVGAGSGFFSRQLLDQTLASEAWCVDTNYETESDKIENGKIVHYRRSVDFVNADLVLLMDVLEHVDDDAALLKEYVNKVPTGCNFLITVPAFQFLWSGHDEFLEHRRRYTLDQMEMIVRNVGLNVRLGVYYFGLVFPIAALIRIAQRATKNSKPARTQLTEHNLITNTILKSLCYLELSFLRVNRTAGLTVFCLADKG